MSDQYKPSSCKKCMNCGHLALSLDTRICELCACGKFNTVQVKEEMLRLAELSSTTIEIVRDSDALHEVQGVGCLLRY